MPNKRYFFEVEEQAQREKGCDALRAQGIDATIVRWDDRPTNPPGQVAVTVPIGDKGRAHRILKDNDITIKHQDEVTPTPERGIGKE